MREAIEHNGRTYKKYGNYFLRSIDGVIHYLHRDIYEENYGPIGKGYVIHHLDENTLNNNIDNLKKITDGEHIILHKTGLKHSEESKKKMSKAAKGKNNHMFGRKHSEETKRKISEAGKKPILQMDKLTGEVIKRWDSATDAGREMNIFRSNIHLCCQGKYKTAYGFAWRFE